MECIAINEIGTDLRSKFVYVVDFGVKTCIVIWKSKKSEEEGICVYKFSSLHATKHYYRRRYMLNDLPDKYRTSAKRLAELFNREYSEEGASIDVPKEWEIAGS